MPTEFFDDKPHLKGHTDGTLSSLCTSTKEVKDYLYNGMKYLAENVPNLGGVISITMSENLTHCYSRSYDGVTSCPACKDKKKHTLAPEVDNIIKRAFKDADSRAEVIGWNWGWSEFLSWTKEEESEAIGLLGSDITFMCVSEEGMKLNKGGVENSIIDYSVSNPGPSERTVRLFKQAKQAGHKIYAKTQINNSWECSAVPFIPAFELVHKHLSGLNKCDIDGIMLGWTLGGYPSFNLSLVSGFYGGEIPDLNDWYKLTFGGAWKAVKSASEMFSEAFTEFPFCLDFLYNGPQNAACANLFFKEKTGLKATMVGYPFDDIDTWRGNYTKEQLISQLKKLCGGWKRGLDIIQGADSLGDSGEYFKRIASAVYCHFLSSLNLALWTVYGQKEVLDSEYENTLNLLKLCADDACLGFEASNHYYYCENTLLEKLINLKYLMAVAVK